MKKISKYAHTFTDAQLPNQSPLGGEDSKEKDFVGEHQKFDVFLAEFLDPARSAHFGQLTMDEQRQILKEKLLYGRESGASQPAKSNGRGLRGQDKRLESGTIIADRYEVESYMAKGGFGEVYKGRHKQLGIKIAIKLIRNENISHKTIRERFLREAKIIANINHPNVVRIYDVGEFSGRVYLVMDFIEGDNLDTYLKKKGKLPSAEYMRLMKHMSDALAEIHRQGVVHRDIKPGNIMVSKSSDAILMDFGLAKERFPHIRTHGDLTVEGLVVGTPLYMAPEQFKPAMEVTKASDVYSLGVTFYQMVTGENPFSGDTFHEVYEKHKNLTPLPVHVLAKTAPRKISSIVEKMLRKVPSDRYSDGVEVAGALRRVDLKNRRYFVWFAALAMPMVLCGIIAFMDWQKLFSPAPAEHPSQVDVWYSAPRIYSVIPIGYRDNGNTYFSDLITNFLAQADYEIVERERIEAIIEELELSQTEWSSKNTAVRIGKLVGAHIIITGNISAYKGIEQVNIRAFNVETSEILGAVKVDIEDPEGAVETLLNTIDERLVYRSFISELAGQDVGLKHGQLYGARRGMKLRVLEHKGNRTLGLLEIFEVKPERTLAKILLDQHELQVGMRVEEIKEEDK